VTQPENRRYLSGFTGSAGTLIVSENRALLATDFRYYQQVGAQAPEYELVQVPETAHVTLAETIDALGYVHVGFESQHLTVETFEQWQKAMPQVEWVPTKGLVEELRLIKDAQEMALIREAVRLADEAMIHIMDWIRPGVTEREVAWELEVHMRTHGAEALSFTTIVASGENGDMPHAVTTDRAIALGDSITIDMGAMCGGYCSDLTRSFCLGHAEPRYERVWRTVLEAQRAAEAAIQAEMPGAEADAVARRIIDATEYVGMFGHGLGHGVGLAIHEGPRASRTSQDALPAGCIVTVEPGIYVPGWGGVRIEDMVLVHQRGCEILSQAPKEMVIHPA
ncbi:MAG: aminopeptidase P family protein, partial [Anaerolineae bacterium]|nr:aminopeptidase P family protein [Anaerolineae bacterium]